MTDNDDGEGKVEEYVIATSKTDGILPSSMAASTVFRDHSSLIAPGSIIRFRSTEMVSRVYSDPQGQFIIEDERDEQGRQIITTKRLETRTATLVALRCVYTLVVVFFVSIQTIMRFLLVFREGSHCWVFQPTFRIQLYVLLLFFTLAIAHTSTET